jgi:hypothetical protein
MSETRHGSPYGQSASGHREFRYTTRHWAFGPRDIQLQLQLHRRKIEQAFGNASSRGIFPPECAFSKRMIPALAAENIEWSLVDNIHFDRAHRDYPWVPESNLPAPNRADQINTAATDWVALNGLWAPSPWPRPGIRHTVNTQSRTC